MISPALRAAFSARLARRNARVAKHGGSFDPGTAAYVLDKARADVSLGLPPMGRPSADILGHGDVIRSRTATGERRTYVIAIIPDSDMGAPWKEHDGHGVIREVGRGRQKAPGEVLFSSGDRHGAVYAYDVPESLVLARKDGWGLRPDHAAALERRLGRTPTARQITAEAVRLDMERCRDWLCDRWSWIGVALIEMPRRATAWDSTNGQEVADAWAGERGGPVGRMVASLWGIESDSPDYHHAVALELVREANAA